MPMAGSPGFPTAVGTSASATMSMVDRVNAMVTPDISESTSAERANARSTGSCSRLSWSPVRLCGGVTVGMRAPVFLCARRVRFANGRAVAHRLVDERAHIHDERDAAVAQDRRARHTRDVAHEVAQGLDDDLLLPDQPVDDQADL